MLNLKLDIPQSWFNAEVRGEHFVTREKKGIWAYQLDMLYVVQEICKKHNIQVTCVADGSQLGFIDTIDLYSILGNAMDNAIEAVEKFEEKEKCQIDVMIYRQHNFLVMNIINPIPEQLIYEEGIPLTNKKDKLSHGFGLRSIRQILRKYEGFLNISEEDGCFSLKMLIPIQLKVTT